MTLNPETAKIYAIKSFQSEFVYIGSTKLPIKLRFAIHKAQYKKHLANSYPFLTSFNIISYPDCYIVLLDEFPYTDKLQLRIKENEYIQYIKDELLRSRDENIFLSAEKLLMQDAAFIILWYNEDWALKQAALRDFGTNSIGYIDLKKVFFRTPTAEEYANK